jgi:hypothetical protein
MSEAWPAMRCEGILKDGVERPIRAAAAGTVLVRTRRIFTVCLTDCSVFWKLGMLSVIEALGSSVKQRLRAVIAGPIPGQYTALRVQSAHYLGNNKYTKILS